METRDWMGLKSEYVTGRESLAGIAKKHGIPLRTMKEKSSNEGWVQQRRNFRTDTAQKVYQKTAKKEVKRLERLREVAEDIAELIAEDIMQLKEIHKQRKALTETDIKMIKELTIALKNIADIMRDVYAIPNIREKLLLDKYKDDKKALEGAEKNAGGIIILPEITWEEEVDEDDMATPAEAD